MLNQKDEYATKIQEKILKRSKYKESDDILFSQIGYQ